MEIDLIYQAPITEKRIIEMVSSVKWKPRRMQLKTQWPEPLHEPKSEEENWRLILPFCETFKNAFHSMCFVNSIGLREVSGRRCLTFFNDAKENKDTLIQVQSWLDIIGPYVALRDGLALSFAIDYDREKGDPKRPSTKIGKLRRRAKTYDAHPTSDTYVAADELVRVCLNVLKEVSCYNSADVIVAMPPSKLNKPFDLPGYLAKGIAKGCSKINLSHSLRTVRERPPIKDCEWKKKLNALKGTIELDPDSFKDKIVLLVDDLYQSGISINYVAMLLLEVGAKKVFGLTCEKTCSNDDNVSRKKVYE